MSFHLFAPKTLGSIGIGSGVLGGGGVIYWYQIPTTWKELLVKEGYVFLSNEYDYKGMFEDQKNGSDWQGEDSLKNSNDSNVQTNVEKYCNKLSESLPDSSDTDYEKKKRKFIAFCTSDGIKTVKARIVQSKKSSLSWISESDEDKWKAVFAVYRYEPQFIDWLKADNKDANKDLSKDSIVDDEYTKLKTACTNLLKKNHKEVLEDHIKYGSWWCVELGYKTIKEKIKKSDANWEEKGQSDSDWEELKNKWKDTEVVKKWANKAANSGSQQSDSSPQELTEDSLKKLCNSDSVESQLSDNDSYQEKYTVIKSVCRKESTK